MTLLIPLYISSDWREEYTGEPSLELRQICTHLKKRLRNSTGKGSGPTFLSRGAMREQMEGMVPEMGKSRRHLRSTLPSFSLIRMSGAKDIASHGLFDAGVRE